MSKKATLATLDELTAVSEELGLYTEPPVFVLELPLELAPTMNVYSGLKGWAKGKLRTAVDVEIILQMARWVDGRRGTDLKAKGRRRAIVTRYSSREPDDISADCIGGKLALDRLVVAELLTGDSRKHLLREARWFPAKPGKGKLTVEVFDV